MKLNQQQVQHFFLRAGFGQPIKTIQQWQGKDSQKLFEEQLKLSAKSAPVKVATEYASPAEMRNMPPEKKKKMQKEGRSEVKALNTLWLKEMATSNAQLREKMSFFWHDHFACRSKNPLYIQAYLDVIRTNALGNFGDLLRSVSKTPAMLQYLNNQQNKKRSPNENFAREVMELFTLGRDKGYTEKDISEAARAFTGWSINGEGQFIFRKNTHDQGTKTILGQSGNMAGDDVIDLLLAKKETARYISQKWVRFFMNYDGDQQLEKQIADELFRTKYDIKSGLEVLFTAKEFYQKQHIGSRIKSPIELITIMQRQLHVTITHDQSLLYLQRTLDQILFDPPNVAGWNDGKDWVDSASLLFRMKLPQLVFKSALIQNQVESYDDNDSFKINGQLKKLKTDLDTRAMNNSFNKIGFSDMATYLLQSNSKGDSPKGNFIDQIIYITSKPEYQLC